MTKLCSSEYKPCQSHRSLTNKPTMSASHQQFSTAGFFHTESSPRDLFNFGTGWRFFKSSHPQGGELSLDDSQWEIINAPHCVELLPEDASGSINYQGEVWYRKHFDLSECFSNKRIFINFEAIQGKYQIWINGQKVRENYEGILGIVLDIT